MTTYTARALSTNRLQFSVNQAIHGFAVGDIIKYDGASYVRAQADSLANSIVVGMVSYVIDVNNFVVTQVGHISGITTQAFTPPNLYYLSPSSPGRLTLTAPTADGDVVEPLFIAHGADEGFFNAVQGELITPGGAGTFKWNVANVNTGMSVNNGYIINGAGTLTMTMPTPANPGDIVELAGYAHGWVLQLNPGQTIHFGNVNTSSGGTISSNVSYDAIRVICVVATTDWLVLSADGNLTIT